MDLATKPHPISISMQPNVDIYFNAFPYAIPAVGEMNILEFHPDDAFFVGENGSGKSTILEATRPESSPLSWNSLTITIPVNQHCLFDTFDPARNAVEQRLLVNSEPAPPHLLGICAGCGFLQSRCCSGASGGWTGRRLSIARRAHCCQRALQQDPQNMKTLASQLSEAGRRWTGAGPASESDIAELKRAAGFTLPREYVELLRTCNGGEGELALPPLWFQLFDVPFAIQMASNDFYRRELDGLFLFGSNGGLETIALDMRGASPWPILMVDCVAGLDSAVQIAESFSEFIDAIGRPAAMDDA